MADREPGFLGRAIFGAGSADFPAKVSAARRRYAQFMTAGLIASMAIAASLVGTLTGSLPWALLALGSTGLTGLFAVALLDLLGVAPPTGQPEK